MEKHCYVNEIYCRYYNKILYFAFHINMIVFIQSNHNQFILAPFV